MVALGGGSDDSVAGAVTTMSIGRGQVQTDLQSGVLDCQSPCCCAAAVHQKEAIVRSVTWLAKSQILIHRLAACDDSRA